ncbi:hypothetical protein [Sphingomonas sp. 1P08PE]|uniref:hypothetical protein n=1 Tax=Sphingomonas sp. 1P08PE TaxID=554122 RepID=UPI0039A273CD
MKKILLRTPAGMKPWHGGDKPPADWEGGAALFRDGTLSDLYSDGWDWGHHPDDPPHVRAVEIIAYWPAA